MRQTFIYNAIALAVAASLTGQALAADDKKPEKEKKTDNETTKVDSKKNRKKLKLLSLVVRQVVLGSAKKMPALRSLTLMQATSNASHQKAPPTYSKQSPAYG